MVFLAVSQGSPDQIAFYDQSGVQIDDYTLPREIPLLVPKRWGWLLVAPIGDTVLFVIWFPIILVSPITSLF